MGTGVVRFGHHHHPGGRKHRWFLLWGGWPPSSLHKCHLRPRLPVSDLDVALAADCALLKASTQRDPAWWLACWSTPRAPLVFTSALCTPRSRRTHNLRNLRGQVPCGHCQRGLRSAQSAADTSDKTVDLRPQVPSSPSRNDRRWRACLLSQASRWRPRFLLLGCTDDAGGPRAREERVSSHLAVGPCRQAGSVLCAALIALVPACSRSDLFDGFVGRVTSGEVL